MYYTGLNDQFEGYAICILNTNLHSIFMNVNSKNEKIWRWWDVIIDNYKWLVEPPI